MRRLCRKRITVQEVSDALRKRIREDGWPLSGILPPLRKLAIEYTCSVPTLHKAIALLRESGALLDSLPKGSRIRSVIAPDATFDLPLESLAFERISSRIRSDILKGHFTPGSVLPSLKELMSCMGGSHPTIRRALHHLMQEDYIETFGRGYRVKAGLVTKRAGSQVVILTGRKSLWGQSGFVLSFCKSFESEAHRRQWPNPIICQDFRPDKTPLPDRSTIAGYIGIPTGDSKGWAAFFNRQPTMPYVTISLMEMVRSSYKRHSLFFRLMSDNRTAGREVALHLRARGHVHCAFFSTVQLDQPWARLRLEGVREVFQSGANGDIEVFVNGVGSMADSASEISEECRNWVDSMNSGASWLSVFTEPIKASGVTDYRSCCVSLWNSLENTIGQKSITAWIGINDFTCALLLSYLRWKSVSVPARIAVAGFDNSSLALAMGLTSFDLGAPEFASMAMQALTDPSAVRSLTHQNTVRIKGTLFVRSTT